MPAHPGVGQGPRSFDGAAGRVYDVAMGKGPAPGEIAFEPTGAASNDEHSRLPQPLARNIRKTIGMPAEIGFAGRSEVIPNLHLRYRQPVRIFGRVRAWLLGRSSTHGNLISILLLRFGRGARSSEPFLASVGTTRFAAIFRLVPVIFAGGVFGLPDAASAYCRAAPPHP